jgi:NitT/TauT family transport system substrate-binding protein
MRSLLMGALLASVSFTAADQALAEATELRVAKQYGLGYTQMIIMEDQALIEKHAKEAGLGDVTVTWNTFRSSDVMNDALLSGNLDIASLGVPGLAIIWAKTQGLPVEVKGLVGMNVAPLILNSRDEHVRSLADYREGDRIAVPAIKVSTQAILLQMGAAKIWGQDQYTRLDPLTVSMTHPDSMTALLSGAGEVGSHFASPPFAQQELAAPGIHQVTSSTEILGSDLSFNVLATPTSFHDENPKLVQAFLGALEEATAIIEQDKRAAAETYIRVTGGKQTPEELVAIMEEGVVYTTQPQGTLPVFQFMAEIGTIKVRPEQWTEYMHTVAHQMDGS